MLEEYFARIRHNEFLAEAERNRLLEMAEKNQSHGISTAARFMVFVGGLLRRWGSRLEDRFAIDSNSHQIQPVDHRMEL